jgi:hypothetical protein
MGLNAAEQREFQQRMERKQLKEFMGVSCNSGPFVRSPSILYTRDGPLRVELCTAIVNQLLQGIRRT